MIRILLQQVRRDRLTLPIWVLGTALLLVTAASSVGQEYGDAGGRANILAVALATPAILALRGIPNGDSLGSAVHFQSYAFLAVMIGLMNVFLATRHNRADEEKGRRELVLATPVSRLTPPIATLILGLVANGVFVLLAIGGYSAVKVPAEGAVLSATALGVTGLAFRGLTLLAGELTATSRGANTIGVVLVLGAYALRAAGDALGTPDITKLTLQPAWPSWVSPIGWGQQTLAFTDEVWWPVAALGGLAVVSAVVALVIHSRRELDASLLPQRVGRSAARAGFGSPVALAWRLQWPTLVAWAGGSALFGFALGSLVSSIANAKLDNPQVTAILESLGHTQGDVGRTLLVAVFVIIAAVAGAAGVQAVLRMREEESDGHLEPVLATPRSRVAWFLSFAGIGLLTVVIVMVATGLTSAISFFALGDVDDAWLSIGSALAALPAVLTFTGIAALAVGLLPRASIAIGWGAYGLLAGLGMFGGLMGIDDDVVKAISPIANVPALPTDDWVPTIVLGGIVIVTLVLGALAFRRRDLST